MPADPPLVDPKAEKLLEPPKGEDATLETSDPRTDNQSPHKTWVGMYTGI